MRAWDVLIDAWRERGKLGDQHRTRELAAFLPPALEIQESPPHPLAKWLGRTLMILLIMAMTWACVGQVNIVASAEGKIIPSSRVKQIQPLEKGVIKHIYVTEGEHVTQGQPLIELDSTLTEADKARLTNELTSAQFRRSVSKTLLGLIDNKNNTNAPDFWSSLPLIDSPESSSEDVTLNKKLLRQQWEYYQSQLRGLQSSLLQARYQQGVGTARIDKLAKTLPIIAKRRDSMRVLKKKNYVSETDLLQVEQEYIQTHQDLLAEREQYQQFLAAEDEINQQIGQLKAQIRQQNLTDIMAANREIAVLKEELTKATDLNSKHVLYAPVAGQVQELSVTTIGGVVTEAQQLMLLVPEGEQLEVEVFLENKDIGFVTEGMASEIKIHTFPFTKYGLIDGEVMTISNDAVVDEKKGLIYSMQILMKQNTLLVNGRDTQLIPGMAVTAEFKIGKRRIIEFFLAPLLRAKSESIRER